MQNSRGITILSFHLLLLTALLLFTAKAPLGDWGNYYYGAKAIGEGHGSETYDPIFFNDYVAGHRQENFFLSYTQVPPFTAVIFRALNALPVFPAREVWLAVTALLCCFSLARLFRRLNLDERWSLLLPILFLLPLRSHMEQGQSYLLLVALLAEGWIARDKNQTWLAAFLFALSIHLKIFPAIILLWLLFERDWKSLGKTMVVLLALFAVSLPLVHWETWKFYLTDILPRLAKGEITDPWATAYQSMDVFLRQQFIPDGVLNPHAWKNSPVLFMTFNFAWKGIVLLIAALFSLDKTKSSFTRFSVWLFAGMLISGYGSSYGLLLLILPAIAVLSSPLSQQRKFILIFLLLMIANLPVQWFAGLNGVLRFPRLWTTVLLLIMLVILFRPRWNKLALLVLLLPALSFTGRRKANDESLYFLRDPSLLITSFDFDKNHIYYTRREITGLQKDTADFPDIIHLHREITYTPHQVFTSKGSLYFYNENIRSPMLFNDRYLLYLSDKNRGPGFYTIRFLDLH